jgi:hypothetical protein
MSLFARRSKWASRTLRNLPPSSIPSVWVSSRSSGNSRFQGQKDETFINTEIYKLNVYTGSSDILDFGFWPALRLTINFALSGQGLVLQRDGRVRIAPGWSSFQPDTEEGLLLSRTSPTISTRYPELDPKTTGQLLNYTPRSALESGIISHRWDLGFQTRSPLSGHFQDRNGGPDFVPQRRRRSRITEPAGDPKLGRAYR